MNPLRKTIPWTVPVAIMLLLAAWFTLRDVRYRASTRPHAAHTETRSAPVMTVTTWSVARTRIQTTLPVTGSVSATDELSIGAEAMGLRIVEVKVEEHDTVRRGQVLAVLDDSILQAQLQQDEARLQGALATESKARQPNRPQDIEGLQAAVSQARAQIEQQRANLVQAQATLANDEQNEARYRTLLRQGFVSVADAHNVFTLATRDRALVAAAQDQVRAAQETAAQAQSRLQLGHLGGSWQDVQIASASRAEIQAEIRQLQVQIAQTRIRAPDDGLIVKRDAHLGAISSAGQSLFTMVRKSALELQAQVPEAELLRLRVGDAVQVSGYGRSEIGRIWLITPLVDTTTRLGVARIRLPHNSGYLPGMFVRGVVHEGSHLAITVPLKAVQGPAEQQYVYLYRKGFARRCPVELGQTTGTQTEIVRGLQTGDNIIVEGAAFINDGDSVLLSSKVMRAQDTGRPVSDGGTSPSDT